MSEKQTHHQSRQSGCLNGWGCLLLAVMGVSVVVLVVANWARWDPEPIGIALLLGWWRYPARVLPEANWSPALIAQAGVVAVFTFIALHGFCAWIARNNGRSWRRRWTGALIAAAGLAFGVCLITVGLLSHGAWLRRNGLTEPNDWKMVRAIGGKLEQWAGMQNGAYPGSLDELPGFNPGIQAPAHGYVPGHSAASPDGVVLVYFQASGGLTSCYLKGGGVDYFRAPEFRAALLHSILEARRLAAGSEP